MRFVPHRILPVPETDHFWRVHRGTIVSSIECCMRDAEAHLHLHLKGGAKIPVSRAYAHLSRQM